MKIRYSRSRTLLSALLAGVTMVNLSATLSEPFYEIPVVGLDAVPVKLPEVESETPIVVRICPEFRFRGRDFNGYRENNNIYFSKEKGMNCTPGGGGAGGGF